jgi:16S rRNA processing protein RimM
VSSTEPKGPAQPLRIGRVARAHGLKGELEIRLDWPDSRSLLEATGVLLSLPDGSTVSHSIAGTRRTPKGVLLRLEGIADRDAAEAVLGATLSVPRADLPPLQDGEYYLCDLVGLEVKGPAGSVGRVLEVQMYPSVDSIVIEAPAGERLELPLLAEWLERVDVPAGCITLRSIDGLIEMARPPSGGSAEPAPTSDPAEG